jgi:NTP pyrophosphatase (non-canonical NTP hydrolase)
MTPSAYQQAAIRTECNQKHSYLRLQHLIPHEGATYRYDDDMLENTRLLHAIMGMGSEVGELLSVMLKTIYYGKAMTHEELKLKFLDELGDVQWFLAQACTILDLNLEDMMEANIAKLRERFPDKFTNYKSAQENRNPAAESKAQLSALRGGPTVNGSEELKKFDGKQVPLLDSSKKQIGVATLISDGTSLCATASIDTIAAHNPTPMDYEMEHDNS